MRRLLILIFIILGFLGLSAWWWLKSGTAQQAMESEIALTRQQFSACGLPLQFSVEEIERAGFPWNPRVVLHGVELAMIQGNGQSLSYRAEKIPVELLQAELTLGSGPLRGLGGGVKGADANQKAPAWRLVGPTHFTVSESGSRTRYDVSLAAGGIAVLVLADGAPAVTAESRPVRVRFPAELIFQVKRESDDAGEATITGTRKFQFPSIASGWITHPLCDTGRAQALYGLIQSISGQAARTQEAQ